MNFSDDFIITCPLCGFSFKIIDLRSKKKVKRCPMCGYKLLDNKDFPRSSDHLDRRIC